MLTLLGIVAFASLIALSIAAHEAGHLAAAKAFKVKVTEYMIGFGPSLFSRTRGETTYGVKLIPLGGYIRMLGMLAPPSLDGPPPGRWSMLAYQARVAAQDESKSTPTDRLFYALPGRKRVVIMLAGPFMNLVLAFILFSIVLVGIGIPAPSLEVGTVAACTPSAQLTTEATPEGDCPAGTVPSPAALAGLRVGDVVRSVNGQEVTSWLSLVSWIRDNPGQAALLSVSRAGQPVEVPVTLVQADLPVFDAQGVATGEVRSSGYLGAAPAFVPERTSITAVPGYMASVTGQSLAALVALPARFYDLLTDTLISGGERSLDSPMSVVGATRLGGEIASNEAPAPSRVAAFLALAASLNLFLFLFNLLPLLPLDGGHVAAAFFEWLRRTRARLGGRADPGPFDTAMLLPVSYLVAAVFVAFSLVVILADIIKPVTLG